MGLLDKFKKKRPYTSRIDFNARGVDHCLDGLVKLQQPNPLWNSTPELVIKNHRAMNKIPEFYYSSYPVKLVPEPKNEHDSNAIKVTVDGKKIGYVPSELCVQVKKIMRENPQYGLSAWITGGKYRLVFENGEEEVLENNITVRIYLYY